MLKVPFFRQRAVFRQALALTQMIQINYRSASHLLVESIHPIERFLLAHCFCKLDNFERARAIIQATNDNVPLVMQAFKRELSAQFGLSNERPKYDEQWLFTRETEFILQAA